MTRRSSSRTIDLINDTPRSRRTLSIHVMSASSPGLGVSTRSPLDATPPALSNDPSFAFQTLLYIAQGLSSLILSAVPPSATPVPLPPALAYTQQSLITTLSNVITCSLIVISTPTLPASHPPASPSCPITIASTEPTGSFSSHPSTSPSIPPPSHPTLTIRLVTPILPIPPRRRTASPPTTTSLPVSLPSRPRSPPAITRPSSIPRINRAVCLSSNPYAAITLDDDDEVPTDSPLPTPLPPPQPSALVTSFLPVAGASETQVELDSQWPPQPSALVTSLLPVAGASETPATTPTPALSSFLSTTHAADAQVEQDCTAIPIASQLLSHIATECLPAAPTGLVDSLASIVDSTSITSTLPQATSHTSACTLASNLAPLLTPTVSPEARLTRSQTQPTHPFFANIRSRGGRHLVHFQGCYLNNSPMCACQEFPMYSSKLRFFGPEPALKRLPPELDHVCLPCARDICSSVGPEMEDQLFRWLPGVWNELDRFYYNFYTPDEHGANVDRLSQEAYDEKCLDHQRCAEQLVAKYAADSNTEGEEGKEEDGAEREASSTTEEKAEEKKNEGEREKKKEEAEKEENGKSKKKKKKKRQGRKAKKVERMQTLEEKEDEGDSEERETGQEQKENGQEEGKGMGEDERENDGEGEEKEEAEEEEGKHR